MQDGLSCNLYGVPVIPNRIQTAPGTHQRLARSALVLARAARGFAVAAVARRVAVRHGQRQPRRGDRGARRNGHFLCGAVPGRLQIPVGFSFLSHLHFHGLGALGRGQM